MSQDQKRAKLRVLFVCTHPVQYAAPMFRRMARDPRLDIFVAYCSLEGAESHLDPEFGVRYSWDIPLLEDYPWKHVRNRSWQPGLGGAWGLFNPGLWDLVQRVKPDAVVLLTGYRYVSFWIALCAAKMQGIPVLFGTDASELGARNGQKWKAVVKRWGWPSLFRLADAVIVPSSRGVKLMESLGISPKHVTLTPYVVDNDWWMQEAARADRAAVRRAWACLSMCRWCSSAPSCNHGKDLRTCSEASLPQACQTRIWCLQGTDRSAARWKRKHAPWD